MKNKDLISLQKSHTFAINNLQQLEYHIRIIEKSLKIITGIDFKLEFNNYTGIYLQPFNNNDFSLDLADIINLLVEGQNLDIDSVQDLLTL